MRAIITDDAEVKDLVKSLQRELFAVGSALATAPTGSKKEPPVTSAMVDALTAHVHRIEATDGILADWSVPGEHPASAAFDVARTVCRRAERQVVRLDRIGRSRESAGSRVSEPVVGSAVAPRTAHRKAGRRRCAVTGRQDAGRALVAGVVTPMKPVIPAPVNPFSDDERRGVYRAIYERRDVRSRFIAAPLPDDVLARILDAAHHAPSVGFMQPWEFIVIADGPCVGGRQQFDEANPRAASAYTGERRDLYDR